MRAITVRKGKAKEKITLSVELLAGVRWLGIVTLSYRVTWLSDTGSPGDRALSLFFPLSERAM